MGKRRTAGRFVSLWIAAAMVLGVFAGMPLAAATTDSNLSTPDSLGWKASGTATWGRVENAGKANDWGNKDYYKWQLYLHNDGDITDVNEFTPSNEVRWGNIGGNEPSESVNLASYMDQEGYYYFAVFAYGDGVDYNNSDTALSPSFHYTIKETKLPTPTNLSWAFHAPEGKYFGVWENIFGAEFEKAEGFNVIFEEETSQNSFDHFFTREELLEDQAEGRPGAMLWTSNPNGRYRFQVQAMSSDINQVGSSEVSEFSPWQQIPSTPIGGGGGGSSGGGGGSGSGGSLLGTGSSTGAAKSNPTVQTSTQIKDLASAAKSKGETVARSSGTQEATVKGAAWAQLTGLHFQHDTIANGAVQVRVTINNPTAITQDVKVSAYVAGKDVERVSNLFSKHFSNEVRAMHFDQSGAWGQDVRIAAKFDLTGMDESNLVFYSFDRSNHTYTRIEKTGYSVDANGYTHFSTPNAGDIVVSDGALSKK